jgi:L-asparaginase II
MDDGNNARAAEVAIAAAIEQLLDLAPQDAQFMRGFSEPALCNWNGIEVGTLGATDDLRRALLAAAP